MTSDMSQPPERPLDPQYAARQLTEAVATVKALVAAGLLDAASLGLGSAPATAQAASSPGTRAGGVAEGLRLVPGDPITVRDLAEKTSRGLKENTGRTYGTYLNFLVDGWPAKAPEAEKLYAGMGDRWAHEVLASELEEALKWVERRALVGAHWRAERRLDVGRVARHSDASGARYNAVGAWRRMFATAVKDRHLAKGYDPAQEVEKPRRSNGNRRPLRQQQMEEFWALVGGTGDDPELDRILCETILISGARREGLMNLQLAGIDLEECTILLDEKFGKVVPQPVPDWFAHRLQTFAVSRGAKRPDDKVFRTRRTARLEPMPISSRRLDYLFQRLQSAYPWADKAQVTAHVLRHHAIGVVERHAGKAVSLRFARHEPEDTNDRYGRASRREVAQAVVGLHGGDHPWLHRDPGD